MSGEDYSYLIDGRAFLDMPSLSGGDLVSEQNAVISEAVVQDSQENVGGDGGLGGNHDANDIDDEEMDKEEDGRQAVEPLTDAQQHGDAAESTVQDIGVGGAADQITENQNPATASTTQMETGQEGVGVGAETNVGAMNPPSFLDYLLCDPIPRLLPYEGMDLPCDGPANIGSYMALYRYHEKMSEAPKGQVSSDEALRRIALRKWKPQYEPRMRLSKFKFGKSLGAGSFGKVFEASFGGNKVAVKQINLTQMRPEEAFKERDLMIFLRNKRICRLDGAFFEGSIFLVMELCAGSLTNLFYKARAIHKRCYIIQFLEGLAWIHSKNVVHCDLRPDNLLVGSDGMLKISDFGSSIILPQGISAVRARRALGVAYYQDSDTNKHNEYSKQSDLFSACCIIFELSSEYRYFLKYREQVGVEEYIDAYDNGRKIITCAEDWKKEHIEREPLSRRVERSDLKGLLSELLGPKGIRISAHDALRHRDISEMKNKFKIEDKHVDTTTPKVKMSENVPSGPVARIEFVPFDILEKNYPFLSRIYYDIQQDPALTRVVSELRGVGPNIAHPTSSSSSKDTGVQQAQVSDVAPVTPGITAPRVEAEFEKNFITRREFDAFREQVPDMIKRAVSEALAAQKTSTIQKPVSEASSTQQTLRPPVSLPQVGVGEGNQAGTSASSETCVVGVRTSLNVGGTAGAASTTNLPPPPPLYVKEYPPYVPPQPSQQKKGTKKKRSVSPLRNGGGAPEQHIPSVPRALANASNKSSKKNLVKKPQGQQQQQESKSSVGAKSKSTNKFQKKRRGKTPAPKLLKTKKKKVQKESESSSEADEEVSEKVPEAGSEESSDESSGYEYLCPFCKRRDPDKGKSRKHIETCKKNPHRVSRSKQ